MFGRKSLEIDRWWKMLAVAGLTLALVAAAVKFVPALMIGLGALIMGIAEWQQHVELTLTAEGYGYASGKAHTFVREYHPIAMILEACGGLLIVAGFVKLLWSI
jgi:hypothetical protein